MNGKKVEELQSGIRAKVPDIELSFEVIDNWLTVKPTSFLGSDNFSKLQAAVRELGGEYVSLGKLSHFRFQIAPTEKTLREYYVAQRRLSEPMPLPVTLNFTVAISSPEQLGKYLEEMKKHIGFVGSE